MRFTSERPVCPKRNGCRLRQGAITWVVPSPASQDPAHRLSVLIGSLQEAVLLEDEHRRIELVNQAFCDLFAIPAPPPALIGADCSNAAEQSKALFSDPEEFVARVSALLAARLQVTGEVITMADGRVLERDYIPIFLGKDYRGHLWKYRDITARVRETQRQSAESRWMQMVIDGMMEGLLMVQQADGIIAFANPFAERLFRFPPGEMVGHHVGELVGGPQRDDPAFLMRAYEQAIGTTTEWAARRRDGTEFQMELQLTEFDPGEGRRLVGFVRDLSERHAVDRMKKEFVSTVSHELRTPLTSIRASLGLLDGGIAGPLNADARELVGVAHRSVVRLIGLINDILDLERAEGPAGLPLTRVPVGLDAIMQRATSAVAAIAAEHGVELNLFLGGHQVLGDADRIEQVVVNLLSNAVKFSPMGETVVARSRRDGQSIRVEVSDRGPGVPAAFRPVIFEPFRQAESADNRRLGGSGLGLTISRAIVRQHGGEIGLEDREGGGSTFWFTLPVSEESRA
jgi:PAS domain S-box-containing protein